jgi:argininosuccinate lyase
VLTLMKGLPLAYNRDMQEDKEPLFDTVDTVTACLKALGQMMKKVRFDREKMAKATYEGFLTATDIAEYLVKKGMPFREAHEVTGRIVGYCADSGKTLEQLNRSELKGFSKLIGDDIAGFITAGASVKGKKSYGSTSIKLVSARIRKIKNRK